MQTYSGAYAGSKIRPLLKNAKESIWIVSPWLGKEYATLLTQLSQKGIEVRIITSKDKFNVESIDILKACENPNLSFLVLDKDGPDEKGVFIHSKIYLVDKKFGVSGSANLTYSGLNKNIETLTIAETAEEVEQIENNFMRLWLKYERKSLSKEALARTSVLIRNAIPLANIDQVFGGSLENLMLDDLKLTYRPYYFFEFIFRGSVRSPPLSFEDKGFVIMDAITRQIVQDGLLSEEINRNPVTDYILNTENKYKLEVLSPKSDYREARELAYDHIIQENTQYYTQYYRGGRGYERLYVPRKYEISFLKNYLVSVPVWSFESKFTDGLKHSSLKFASSGIYWQDKVYCPQCKSKIQANEILKCQFCGKRICQTCVRETGIIFKKKLCQKC